MAKPKHEGKRTMSVKLEGVFPAMLTPFVRNGDQVDFDRGRDLARWLVDKGVHGLLIGGTTGEGLLMKLRERKRLLEDVIDEVGNEVAVIAHTGCLDTATTIELTRHAKDAHAVAAAVVVPGFFAHDHRALAQHFKAVAAAAKGFPIFLYNIPDYARNNLTPALVAELANMIENVVGLKDSAGNMVAFNNIVAKTPEEFCLLNGTDAYTYQALMSGASGCISITANAFPEIMVSIFANVKKSQFAKARAKQLALLRACEVLHHGPIIANHREALLLRGFDTGFSRPPTRELTAKEKKTLANALKAARLI